MRIENLPQLIQRQHNHRMPLALHRHTIEPETSHAGQVSFPPGHVLGLNAAGFDVVEDAGTLELVHGWGGIV